MDIENYFCQNCGGKCIDSKKYKSLKSELGFQTREKVYVCEKCGAEHIVCHECEGIGFFNSFDPEDCSYCHGMGVILIK